MDANVALSEIRRKKWRGMALLWFAQALIAFFRVIFRALEVVSPPNRRQRLRELREKLDAINQVKKEATALIQGGSIFDGLEYVDSMLMQHTSGEYQKGLQETLDHTRALRQESEALQAIRRQSDGDNALAVEGYRQFLQDHPNSHLAYMYLGGALKKAGEFDGSIAAYRETIRLAGDNSVGGSNAHIAIGEVLRNKGDFSGAISEFKYVIDNASESSQVIVAIAFLHLGNTLHETGERDEARAAWKQAIKWDNTGLIAKKVREQLKAKP